MRSWKQQCSIRLEYCINPEYSNQNYKIIFQISDDSTNVLNHNQTSAVFVAVPVIFPIMQKLENVEQNK